MTTSGSTVPQATTLRKATARDKAAMLAAMAPHRNIHFPGGLMSDRVRIAEIGGHVLGFVGWRSGRSRPSTWRMPGGASGWWGGCCSPPEHAIGAAGYRTVRVVIDAEATRAHRFYQKSDYVTEDGDVDADVIWMSKELP